LPRIINIAVCKIWKRVKLWVAVERELNRYFIQNKLPKMSLRDKLFYKLQVINYQNIIKQRNAPIMSATSNYLQQLAEFATPERGQKFGTTELQKFVAFLGEFIPQIENATLDKTITFWEGIGLAPALIQGSRLFLNLRQIGEELRDLDNTEKNELIAQIKNLSAFSSKNSQEIIEILDIAAEMVIGSYALFKLGVKLAQKIKK